VSALELQGVAFVAGGRRLLDDISLSLAESERVAVVGANGSGKSLVARAAAGLLPGHSGRVTVLGEDWRTGGAELRRRVGVVLQQSALLSDLTVLENVLFGLGRLSGSAERRARMRAERTLSDFAVEHAADQRVSDLSLGERRRADLARVFGADPDLLILDDVFDGLDSEAAQDLEGRIDRRIARRRRALLFVTHNRGVAERLCPRVLRIENGRLSP
jgi:ABC-type multidrug transport system ATPase subunit